MRKLTNLENVQYLQIERDKRDAIKDIRASLKRQNVIAILKELHTIGSISSSNYEENLKLLLEHEGFKI